MLLISIKHQASVKMQHTLSLLIFHLFGLPIMNTPRILISGAGIAGLSLAHCLEQQGIHYVIIEKHATSTHTSSGIALPFNAIQALRKMGLADKVLAVAHQVNDVTYTKKTGKVLAYANLLAAPLNQDKFIAMNRESLHAILLEGIEPRINFNTTIDSFLPTTNGVNVISSNSELNGKYDLVVSAEGIHSPLRKECFPEEETTIDHNIPNWRFVVDQPNHGLQPTYMLDRTELFMVYPLSPDTLYCYAHIFDQTNQYDKGSSSKQLRKVFSQFSEPARSLLNNLDDSTIIRSRLQSVKQPYYKKGRIVFIGDASSACSPLLQQGAASAFEDALCLAKQLAGNPVAQAISVYQNTRSPRVGWTVETSDKPVKLIKAMRNPIGAFIRNKVIQKKGPLNADGWKQLAKMPV